MTNQEERGREREPWLSSLPTYFSYAWLWAIPLLSLVGFGTIVIYALQLPSGIRWSVFATALVIATAAFFAGGFVGFLFGVPHTVQGSAPSTGITKYLGNTNLEQVSDWLTKIIVGVGLVQIGHAVPALSKLAESLKAPLGGQASSGAFGLGLVITAFLFGFLHLYLWSRVLAERAFRFSEPDQRQNETDETAQSTVSSEFHSAQDGHSGDPAQLSKPELLHARWETYLSISIRWHLSACDFDQGWSWPGRLDDRR